MRNFAEAVAENFHSEVELVWDLKSLTHAVAKFALEPIEVVVDFEQREPNGPWHVAFNTLRSPLMDSQHVGLAFYIFNGVFQAVREFIEIRQPDLLVFVSKDDKLANIYATYLRREAPALEQRGYRLEGPHQVDPYTQYTLRRFQPSAWSN